MNRYQSGGDPRFREPAAVVVVFFHAEANSCSDGAAAGQMDWQPDIALPPQSRAVPCHVYFQGFKSEEWMNDISNTDIKTGLWRALPPVIRKKKNI